MRKLLFIKKDKMSAQTQQYMSY